MKRADMLDATVIVLGYNGLSYIDKCLSSILDQDFPISNYEVIWADNCSTDGSAEYVTRCFPSVRVLRFDQNYGFAEGNNRAVDYANGKYIVFLNQDTIVHRKWLSELVHAAESNSRIKACHSNMLMPWHSERLPETQEAMLQCVHIADLTRFGYVGYRQVPFTNEYVRTLFVSGASVLIAREVFKDLDYVFDPDLSAYCEDTDLGLRINSLGYETVLVPTSILYHNQEPQDSLALAVLRKANLIVKNRFLVFFKNMYISEYVLFLPFLLLGAPFKMREFGWEGHKKIIYAFGSIPLTLCSFARALLEFPRYFDKRRKILSKRKREKFWLLRRLVRSSV